MQKLIQISVIIMASFTTIGLCVASDNALMSLAGSSNTLFILRALVAAGALLLVVTQPPRQMIMRVVFGAGSCALLTWTAYSSFTQNFPVLDSLVFMAAGISFALAALEYTPETIADKSQKIPQTKPQFLGR